MIFPPSIKDYPKVNVIRFFYPFYLQYNKKKKKIKLISNILPFFFSYHKKIIIEYVKDQWKTIIPEDPKGLEMTI